MVLPSAPRCEEKAQELPQRAAPVGCDVSCPAQTPSALRRDATCPVALTLYFASSTLPSGSTTIVDRITPMTFLPYIVFSPQAPYSSSTLCSGSESSGKVRNSSSANFVRASGLSGEIPSTV